MLCCTMLYYAMLCADRLQRAAPGMSHEDASSLVFVEPQTSDAFQWRGHTVVRTGFPLSHGRVITAQLHQHQLSTGQLTAQMEQVQEKSNKAESETQRQREEIQDKDRLIQQLSQRLLESTAQPAPTEDATTAISTASLKATRPGLPSMNADGACRAASSEELLPESAGGPTDTHQSVFRHQRGRANPQLSAGDLYPRSGFQTLLSGCLLYTSPSPRD